MSERRKGQAMMQREHPDAASNPVPFIAVLPVGVFLGDELAQRGWDAAALAARLRCPVAEIEALIAGEGELTCEMARRLELALGTPACVWRNLDSLYRAFHRITV
jgi:plasmid maintenance system antidote protein VapI